MEKYTVWLDYGYEGWQPQDFKTLDELKRWLKDQPNRYGQDMRVTQDIEYKIDISVKLSPAPEEDNNG